MMLTLAPVYTWLLLAVLCGLVTWLIVATLRDEPAQSAPNPPQPYRTIRIVQHDRPAPYDWQRDEQ